MPADHALPPAATRPFLGVTTGVAATPENRPKAGGTGRIHDLRRGDAVRLLAEFRALRRDQLEALLFDLQPLRGESRRVATHRVATDLRRRGLVEAVTIAGPLQRATRGYVLTVDGRRVYAPTDPAYPQRRARAPSTLLLGHATMLADIAIALRDGARRAGVALVWESDWEAVTRIGSALAIPDAFVILEHGGWRTRAFIEADRSTEHEDAFAQKVRRYVQLYLADDWRAAISSWPLILTITLSGARARELARIAQKVAVSEGGARIARAFRATSIGVLRAERPFGSIWYLGTDAVPVGILERDAARTVTGRGSAR